MNHEFSPTDLNSNASPFPAGLEDTALIFPSGDRSAIGNPPEQLDLEKWENITPKPLSRMAEPTKPPVTREWIDQINADFASEVTDIAADNFGNVYSIVDSYNSNGDSLIKYDSNGKQQWVKVLGSSGMDYSGESFMTYCGGITTDSTGNIYLSGYTTRNLEGQNAGKKDVWIAKFDTNGNQTWIQQFGSSGDDYSTGIEVDNSGNIYLTGLASASLQGTNPGLAGTWVAKLDNSGKQLWIKPFGASGDDISADLAIDQSGNVYVIGNTTNDLEGLNAGETDVWLTKYDSNGNQKWIQQFGSSDSDLVHGIGIDNSGNIYLAGDTEDDIDGLHSTNYTGDPWVTKFDTNGNQQWIRQFGSSFDSYRPGATDICRGMSIDSSGNTYLTGYTISDFARITAGGQDVWFAKYDSSGNQKWIQQFGSSSNDYSYSIATDNNNNIYLAGKTYGSLEGANNSNFFEAWVAKYSQPKLPSVTITSTDKTAAETIATATANPGEFTITRTGDTTEALDVSYIVSGNAVSEIDYDPLFNSATIPAGATQVTLPLDVIDDSSSEYTEKATLILAANVAYDLGTAKSATVAIADNDKQVVSITAIDPTAAETATGTTVNPGRFRVRRAGDLTNPLTVSYKVSGTATKASDYGFPTTITIPAGKDTVGLPLKVLDDAIIEGEETANITLVAKTNYKVATSAATGTVKIADND
jgi:hypothetical protein